MKQQNKDTPRILVIKLSALGDFIQAMGPMKAIRAHHPDAHITLMTTGMFKKFGEQCGYFDDIIIDKRPKIFDVLGWARLRKQLIQSDFDRVYDLQNNNRTSFYFNLFPKSKRPEWVGAARGASHENNSPERTAGTAYEGHKQTLSLASITTVDIDDLSWVKDDVVQFNLPSPYVLIVSGCAPQHPQKRWPAQHYAALCKALKSEGYTPILLGTEAERDVTNAIENAAAGVVNLTGQTSLFQIAALAHNAAGAIGNDTGPMHMIGPTACPCLALFSSHSNPKKHAPLGQKVQTLQKDDLNHLDPHTVFDTFMKML